MGQDVDSIVFAPEEYEAFTARLKESLGALKQVLQRPGFGEGKASMGAELEFSLVDDEAQPIFKNTEILQALGDAQFTPELNRFNLEYNASPTDLGSDPFAHFRTEVDAALSRARVAAKAEGARLAVVGILPTLRRRHLRADAMTPFNRYRALESALQKLRRGPFKINIDGKEPLNTEVNEITLEGANTSWQIHLRVPQTDFAALYNAAQLATGPALAVAGNSPFLLGHELWDETRIVSFKQSVDVRRDEYLDWHIPPRVGLGHGWVRQGAWEIFAESVALYPTLLPVMGSEDPLGVVKAGGCPKLEELSLHHGTVWRWNRAVYDYHDQGHVRVEFRILPAGPTVLDMLANTAFMVGLTMALAPRMEEWVVGFPFKYAKQNVYRAAQRGLATHLLWPDDNRTPMVYSVPAIDLMLSLIPLAKEGLLSLGIDEAVATEYLDIIEHRVESGQTGASWQRKAAYHLNQTMDKDSALAAMLEAYMDRSEEGGPVSRWTMPKG